MFFFCILGVSRCIWRQAAQTKGKCVHLTKKDLHRDSDLLVKPPKNSSRDLKLREHCGHCWTRRLYKSKSWPQPDMRWIEVQLCCYSHGSFTGTDGICLTLIALIWHDDQCAGAKLLQSAIPALDHSNTFKLFGLDWPVPWKFPQERNISIHSEQSDWNELWSCCQVSTNSAQLTFVGDWAKPEFFTPASVIRRQFRTLLLVSCQGKQWQREEYGEGRKDSERRAWSIPMWHLCNGRHLSATKANTRRIRRTGQT